MGLKGGECQYTLKSGRISVDFMPFQANNCCQSLKFKFPAKAKVFLLVNFAQPAGPGSSPGILPTAKIDMQKYLNPDKILILELKMLAS